MHTHVIDTHTPVTLIRVYARDYTHAFWRYEPSVDTTPHKHTHTCAIDKVIQLQNNTVIKHTLN